MVLSAEFATLRSCCLLIPLFRNSLVHQRYENINVVFGWIVVYLYAEYSACSRKEVRLVFDSGTPSVIRFAIRIYNIL